MVISHTCTVGHTVGTVTQFTMHSRFLFFFFLFRSHIIISPLNITVHKPKTPSLHNSKNTRKITMWMLQISMLTMVAILGLLGLLSSSYRTATIYVEAATVKSGYMTMWTNQHPGPVSGSSCEYANAASTKLGGASWKKTYINRKFYCAVNSALYNGGMGCGGCYKITYTGQGGTGEAGSRAGSAKI